jgi:hypothetical protein
MGPIADELIDPAQRAHVKFYAFFANVMFHEVAHGLGIRTVVGTKLNVRDALKEHYGALEEGKADILGLYMIGKLKQKGELAETEMLDHYVTFTAGLLRSVRFGASEAHGRANMIQFNSFVRDGAVVRDAVTGRYHVEPDKFAATAAALAARLLTVQGDGDYAAAGRMLADEAVIGIDLQSDLDRLARKGVPVDIVFEQGAKVLGLE